MSTKQIQKKIEQINAKLTQGEKETILSEASKEDPVGFTCEKQILNITEVHFVEQVHCYDTTEEVCSLVNYLFKLFRNFDIQNAQFLFNCRFTKPSLKLKLKKDATLNLRKSV